MQLLHTTFRFQKLREKAMVLFRLWYCFSTMCTRCKWHRQCCNTSQGVMNVAFIVLLWSMNTGNNNSPRQTLEAYWGLTLTLSLTPLSSKYTDSARNILHVMQNLTSMLRWVDTVDETHWYLMSAYTVSCDSCSMLSAGIPHCSMEPSATATALCMLFISKNPSSSSQPLVYQIQVKWHFNANKSKSITPQNVQ